MKVQIITQNKISFSIRDATINDYTKAQSCAEFDINIIDFNSDDLWIIDCNHRVRSSIIENVVEMAISTCNKIIIFILPCNKNVTVKNTYDDSYPTNKVPLFSNDRIINDFVKDLGFQYTILRSERTKTEISGIVFDSTLIIEEVSPYKKEYYSNGKKCVVIADGNKYLTSLPIFTTEEHYYSFMKQVIKVDEIIKPSWVDNYCILDDVELNNNYSEQLKILESTTKKIDELNKRKALNDYYKSILYSNGDVLEDVVRVILGKLFQYDLSCHVDEKKSDFVIKINEITFVGEIKGFTGNVNNSNISQVVNHCDLYRELHDDENEDSIKGILVVNSQMKIEPRSRIPIHQNQLDKAKRDNIMIITTPELLKLFDDFESKKIQTEQIVSIFIKTKGEFKHR